MAFQSIDDYIHSFTGEARERLIILRQALKEAFPSADEVFSYGVPAVKSNGKTFMYAAFKSHIGVYPSPPVIEALKEQLSDYESSKGAIQFPFSKPLPLNLITSIAKACLLKE